MSALVCFRDVGFSYQGCAAKALEGVSFEVERGEACALVGPNGCGKSTALRLLVGLDYPSQGTVQVDGFVVDASTMSNRADAKRLRQRVGLVFQDPEVQLFCPTVADEVAFGPRQMGLLEEEIDVRVADCLRMFDLEHLASRAPWRLSGGEKRRCAIACVVSLAPDILCLDEPTNGLDDKSYELVVTFLRSFVKAGKTVLVATHDKAFVQAISAREIRM